MSKILVTGADGQLGRELKLRLEHVMPGVSTYATHSDLDITDDRQVTDILDDKGFTLIINCAAYTAVDRAETDADRCSAVNVDGIANLARHAARSGARIIHLSTDYVFDGNSCRPYREDDIVNPTSVYGITKLAGEQALREIAQDCIIIRTSGLYASHGNNFVHTVISRLADRRPMTVVCDRIFAPTYAGDLADAIVAIATAPDWHAGIYHYSNEGAISWYDFAVAIAHEAGLDTGLIAPVYSEEYICAAPRPAYSVLDRRSIRRQYALTIPHWAESLRRCIAEIKNENI